MFRLAHLSDAHLGPLPAACLRELASKRLLGYLNWHMHRSRRMLHPGAIEAIVADIHATAPDHIAVTGDLVNIALPAEYAAAATWLANLGTPDRVCMVPGNHDAYVPGALETAMATWRNYMRGDDATPSFPFVRIRQNVALIGLSTARATGPFMATGHMDPSQLTRLAAVLSSTRDAGLARVIMMHHPAVDGITKWQSRLVAAERFREVIATNGAELILHGHTHRASTHWIDGLDGPVPVVGVQAASLASSTDRRGAGWNMIEIEKTAGKCTIDLIERGIPSGGGELIDINRTRLRPI